MTFVAILELVREGLIEIVQNEAYAPIHVRKGEGSRGLKLAVDNDLIEGASLAATRDDEAMEAQLAEVPEVANDADIAQDATPGFDDDADDVEDLDDDLDGDLDAIATDSLADQPEPQGQASDAEPTDGDKHE